MGQEPARRATPGPTRPASTPEIGDGTALSTPAVDRDRAACQEPYAGQWPESSGHLNHDQSVFPGPGRLTSAARRPGATSPSATASIGAPRGELEAIYSTRLRRLPGLRLSGLRLSAGPEELRCKDDAMVYGVYELPITW